MTETFQLNTAKKIEFIDITDQVNQVLSKNKVKNGACTIFVKHTTAAILVGEAEDDLLSDFERVISLVPKSGYRHGHGDPTHTPAHILSSITGQSITLPVSGSKLDLGTWQRVLLVELHGPRSREISVVITS